MNSVDVKFDDFISRAWSDHAKQALEVAQRLPKGIDFVEKGEQIPQLAHILTHVYGEHLGKWDQGIALLERLKKSPFFESGSESEEAVSRSIASLEVASGERASLDQFSISDRIRILATAASAMSGQNDSKNAQVRFNQALEAARSTLDKSDPAHRALAVAGNTLACNLEEKKYRSSYDEDLMILAAQTGRKYWEIAGNWLNVERAEYRLAQTYLKAGKQMHALEHARECLKISLQNDAPALELFFAYEALALAEKACGNNAGYAEARAQAERQFDRLNIDDKSWCDSTLKRLEG